MIEGIVAEFESEEPFVEALRHLRGLGYSQLEAFSPFPMPDLDDVLPVRRTWIPWVVLVLGITGATVAYLVLWWTNAIDYPINVGGRPFNSVPTHVPIMFETTVLFAGCSAFAAALLGSGLPRLHHPLFELAGFERTNIDRFWIFLRGAVDAEVLDDVQRELSRFEPVSVRAASSSESEQSERGEGR